jgi:tRNA (guanosine-2'-O-)-methyltransferase
MSPAGLAACDVVAFVPQVGRIGSLNVATATAIALYEVRRAEWAAPSAPSAPSPDSVSVETPGP